MIEEFTYRAKIEYVNMPEPARRVIQPLVVQYSALFPTWAQLIYVRLDETGDGSGTTIECRASYSYREFCMTFHPSFLAQSGEAHKTQVIHEILHAHSCVMGDWARDTIKRLVPEAEAPKFQEQLLEELRQRHESFVQDLALRLAEVLP